MHIAWLGKKSPFCGNVTYGREVTNALLDRGHRVSFLHFAQEDSGDTDWPDCPEVLLPFLFKSTIYTIPTPKSSKVLTESLQKLKPDLVHASLTLSPLDFRLPEICEELEIPLIATFHPPFDSKLRNLSSSTQFLTYQLYAPFLAQYDKVIVFSHLQRNLLVKLGVPRRKLIIIPNGVDIDKKMFRIKNSWGQRWGKNGFAYISFNDMNKLIKENGEICIAVENNFYTTGNRFKTYNL